MTSSGWTTFPIGSSAAADEADGRPWRDASRCEESRRVGAARRLRAAGDRHRQHHPGAGAPACHSRGSGRHDRRSRRARVPTHIQWNGRARGERVRSDCAGRDELQAIPPASTRIEAENRQNNATEDLPGGASNTPNAEDERRILQRIREARRQADIVVVYQHNHVFGSRSRVQGNAVTSISLRPVVLNTIGDG
jgi:hypothetical protein